MSMLGGIAKPVNKLDERLGSLASRALRDDTASDIKALDEAVESGYLPLDATLQQRAHTLQARRQELLLEIAGLRRQSESPLKLLRADQVEAFGKALKSEHRSGIAAALPWQRIQANGGLNFFSLLSFSNKEDTCLSSCGPRSPTTLPR